MIRLTKKYAYLNTKDAQMIDNGWVAMNASTIHDPHTAGTRVWRDDAGQSEFPQLLKEDRTSKCALSDISLEKAIYSLETQERDALGALCVPSNNKLLTSGRVTIVTAHVARIERNFVQENEA